MFPFDFSHAATQINDELIESGELGFGREIAIEVTDKTNADGDIIEVIAGHMTAIDLPRPARTYFDFAVAGGSAIADHKMISESVLHLAYPAMIDVENPGIALPGAAVVNDDIFPTTLLDLCLVDSSAHRRREVTPAFKPAAGAFRGGLQALVVLQAGFFDQNGCAETFPIGRLTCGNLRRGWRGRRRWRRERNHVGSGRLLRRGGRSETRCRLGFLGPRRGLWCRAGSRRRRRGSFRFGAWGDGRARARNRANVFASFEEKLSLFLFSHLTVKPRQNGGD